MTQTPAGAKPILLAFSGGLDTSFCVPWLAETYGRPVVTLTVNTGSIDADDVHVGAMLHPGCIVFSAALAIAQDRGLSGARVMAAVAAGYEAMIRIALAIQVVTSEVGAVPTLIFDEVDAGIGGAVAATVGAQLQALGARRQVLCVTHLPQVAAFADAHYRVTKLGDADAVRADVAPVSGAARIEELARMLAGSAITAKTRAHAKELFLRHRRAD